MKIVKSLKEPGLLITNVCETVKYEVPKEKGVFLGMLAAILGASLLENMWAGKGLIRADEGTISAGEEQDFQCRLIL